MKAILIGAGRGSRLMPHTEDQPKCFAQVGDRRILDWIVHALRDGGTDGLVFIGGYQFQKIREAYPDFVFRENAEWQRNNILSSLFCAADCMDEGFVCSYVDILYRASLVRRLLDHPGDIVLGVDTDWKRRYALRTQHPPDDAEKVAAEGDRVLSISRSIPSESAFGEYIGVAKLSRLGAALLKEHYERARHIYDGRPFRSAASLEKAYLIDLFQDMIEQGVEFRLVRTHGDYMEVDTQEDYDLARRQWPGQLPQA